MQNNFFSKDSKNKKMIIAISVSVAIIVIGLAVFCYFLLANKKEKKAENVQEDPQAKIEEEKRGSKSTASGLENIFEYETDEITTGIDVSEFQGNIDWKAVADSSEIDFAMIRVGYRGMKNGRLRTCLCEIQSAGSIQKWAENWSLFLFHGSDRGRGKRGGGMDEESAFRISGDISGRLQL